MRKHVVISVIGDERLRHVVVSNVNKHFFLSAADLALLKENKLSSLYFGGRRPKKATEKVVRACGELMRGECDHMLVIVREEQACDLMLAIRAELKGTGVRVEHISPRSLALHKSLEVLDTESFQSYIIDNINTNVQNCIQETFNIIDRLRLATSLAHHGIRLRSDIAFAS